MRTQQLTTDRKEKAVGRVLLSVRSLCKSFDGQQVLKGVNLELHEGQVVLLRGPNGSGKTTLVNILTGYLTPDRGEMRFFTNGANENFAFPRRWWHDLNPWDHFLPERVAHKGICRSWQDTRLFQSLSLVDNIAVSDPENLAENPLNVLFRPGISRQAEATVEQRATETLSDLGLNGRSSSSADKISLGQSKRVAIARATGTAARILFLDEPLAGLDGPGIQSVIDLLSQLVDQHRMALVLVEHVSSVHHLLHLVDTIWDLSEGRLTVTSKADSSGDNAVNESNIGLQLLTDGMTLSGSQVLPGGATFDIYRLQDRGSSKPVLQVRDLVVHRGRRLVIGGQTYGRINGIDLTLHAGDLAVLQAPNGWGKTTLLDCLAGIHPSSRGEMIFLGSDILNSPPWVRRRKGIQYLRADKRDFASLSILEYLRISNIASTASSLLTGPSRATGTLSGGERQSLHLGAMQDAQMALHLLDEPFSALDPSRMDHAVGSIRKLLMSRHAVILSVPHPASTFPPKRKELS